METSSLVLATAQVDVDMVTQMWLHHICTTSSFFTPLRRMSSHCKPLPPQSSPPQHNSTAITHYFEDGYSGASSCVGEKNEGKSEGKIRAVITQVPEKKPI
jgi:hypothetical protein